VTRSAASAVRVRSVAARRTEAARSRCARAGPRDLACAYPLRWGCETVIGHQRPTWARADHAAGCEVVTQRGQSKAIGPAGSTLLGLDGGLAGRGRKLHRTKVLEAVMADVVAVTALTFSCRASSWPSCWQPPGRSGARTSGRSGVGAAFTSQRRQPRQTTPTELLTINGGAKS
jgi:hypothetical protein